MPKIKLVGNLLGENSMELSYNFKSAANYFTKIKLFQNASFTI